jgi:hypothetical protein
LCYKYLPSTGSGSEPEKKGPEVEFAVMSTVTEFEEAEATDDLTYIENQDSHSLD